MQANLILLLTFLLIHTPFAYAQNDVPIPPSKSLILKKMDTQLLPEEDQVKELSKKVQSIERNVENLQKELREKSQKVASTEDEIAELTKEIISTEKKYQDQLNKLTSRKSNLSDIIMALYRLKRLPDEAIFLDPSQAEKITTTLAVTQNLSPQLQQKIDDARNEIDKLLELKEKKEKSKQDKTVKTKDLRIAQNELEAIVKERNANYKKTVRDLEILKKEAEEAAKYANSLQELVANLARKNKEQSNLKEEVKKKQIDRVASLPRIVNSGNNLLPVQGVITIGYGQTNTIGAKSDGLYIKPESDGFVVTPVAGKIRYTGEFKNYGNMIIVEHKKNYFSLIAGLDKIDTVVGQVLSAGEPIGQIKGSSLEKMLYYELRRNSKPVNPLSELRGLI